MTQTIGATGSSTVEVPMTPDMYKLLGGDATKLKRTINMMAVGMLVLFVVLGAVTDVLVGMLAIGILIDVILLAISWFYSRKMGKDLHERNFLRTTGPVSVREDTFVNTNDDSTSTTTVYKLAVAEHSFHVDAKLAASVKGMSYGTVDHTKHSHVVFEVLDANGKSTYRHKGY